jgi:hypothetical protein
MQGGRGRHDWDSSAGGQNWEGLRGGYGANDGNDDDDMDATAGADDMMFGSSPGPQWPLEGFQPAAAFGHQPGPTHGATSAGYQPSACFQQQGYQQRPMGGAASFCGEPASFGYRGECTNQPSGGYPTGLAPGAPVAYQPDRLCERRRRMPLALSPSLFCPNHTVGCPHRLSPRLPRDVRPIGLNPSP